VGRGIATVAAASVVAAVAFAGYATSSVSVVTGAVDDVLVRSGKPKPKRWERTKPGKPAAGSSAGFRARVGQPGKTRSQPAHSSRFERVLDQRAAAKTARDAALRERLAQPDERAASSSDDAFRQRVEAKGQPVAKPAAKDFGARVGATPEKRSKHKERPFEKRVEGSGK
jgi:type IV secretory pathway VirB10-like protein